MLDIPEIIQTVEQPAAVIHLVIPSHEMPDAMREAIGELLTALDTQCVAANGPVFAHHMAMPSDRFNFELGIPIASPVKAAGRMKPGRLPAIKVARTTYQGAYDGLPGAWGEFTKWIADNGHTEGPDLWESYVVHPDSDPDPAAWRTQLNRPLVD